MRASRIPIDRWIASILVRIVEFVTSPSTTIALGRLLGIKTSRSNAPSADPPRNVLVLRPDGIGDVIMTGPMLRELRRSAPKSRITLVVSPRSLNFVEMCPYVDSVLTVEIPPPSAVRQRWWRPLSRRAASVVLARRHFRRETYDVAMVPRWGVDIHEASVLAFFSQARKRVGYSELVSEDRALRNAGYDRYFTFLVRDRSVEHEVQRNLRILSALDVDVSSHALEAWLSIEDEDFARRALASADASAIVAVGPGAGNPRRMWPIDRFVEVGRWIIDRGGRLVVIGGAQEVELGHEMRRSLGIGVLDLTNKATLRQTTAILKLSSMFLGNDAGPMHLAAAANIPVIEVSCHPRSGDDLHPNSPKRFGPWHVPSRILQPDEPKLGCQAGCRAAEPHCILEVSASSVISAVDSLMKEEFGSWQSYPVYRSGIGGASW